MFLKIIAYSVNAFQLPHSYSFCLEGFSESSLICEDKKAYRFTQNALILFGSSYVASLPLKLMPVDSITQLLHAPLPILPWQAYSRLR